MALVVFAPAVLVHQADGVARSRQGVQEGGTGAGQQ
jgi:hypothetical protein